MSSGQWFLAKEGDWYSIKKMVTKANGKRSSKRYPKAKYSHITNLGQLKDFVIRLNGKDPRAERIKAKLDFNHAFIDENLMSEYFEYLKTQIPSEKDSGTLYSYLKRYALNFFIGKMDLANPIEWHQHQHIWAKYLLNRDKGLKSNLRIFEKDRIVSAKVIKSIINELNRFSKFLHNQKPDIPALHFEPLSKAALKEHKARRILGGKKRQVQYIPDENWKKITKSLKNKDWRHSILLAYYYGLRRNEAMGLQLTDIKKGYLSITKQLDKVQNNNVSYKPLKGRSARKVPHWFIKPIETHKLITEMNNSKYYHPDVIGNKFTNLCESLKLPRYTLHDLRRSFITNAVRKGIEPEELRLAAGHSNAQTTYQYYVMDSRSLDDEDFMPEDVG